MKITKDELIKQGFTLIPVSECSIKKVNPFENEYVYDLEVDDNNHMFFANNILVHLFYIYCVNVWKGIIVFG